jgi:hypothetical protein
MIEHKFYNLLRLSFHHDWSFQSNSNQWCILDTTDVVLILLKVVLSTNNSSPLIHKCQILTVFCSKKLIDYTYDKKIPQMVERLQVQDPFKTSTRLHSLSFFIYHSSFTRSVWRYQRGNQNPDIKKQATQWSKEKVQKDKQRSTNHTHKNKDRITRTPQKPGVNSCAPEGWAVPAPLVTPVTICVPF